MGHSTSSGRTKSDEQIYNEQIARDQAEIDAFMAKKGDYNSLEINDQIFEKLSQKEFKKWMKDILFQYPGNFVPDDEQWAIEYNDGSVLVLGGGDDVAGVKLTGIKNALYSNEETTAFYGKDIKFEDYSVGLREWQRKTYPRGIAAGRVKLNYDIDWRVDWQ